MSLSMVSEIFKLLKPDIEAGDASLAAETLVNYLVDEGYSPEDIKSAFRDKDVRTALEFYLESPPGEMTETGYIEDEDDSWVDDEDDDWG